MRAPWISSFFFSFFLIFFSSIPHAQSTAANLSTIWTNNESSIRATTFGDGSRIRAILEEGTFTCGFFCNGTCTSYLFAILIIINRDDYDYMETNGPAVIWSANQDNPVREDAILNLTAAGELVLQDVNGSIVWTTNTIGKSVASMNLTDEGNLKLFDGHNSTVWQSFDHPTDCLVPGQKLYPGQKLIPSVSSTDWTAQKDLYSLQVAEEGWFAYVGSNPPQVYYSSLANSTSYGMLNKSGDSLANSTSYVMLNKSGDFRIFPSTGTNDLRGTTPEFPPDYIKLMPDGHLKAFGGTSQQGKKLIADMLTSQNCYPLSCGRNGICLGLDDQQCICPMSSSSRGTDYFKAVDVHQPNKGCIRVTPLTCNATQDQHFIELKNAKYFTDIGHMEGVDVETCKQACLNNCSCKAAIFRYYDFNSSDGYCELPSELFTMTIFDENGDGVHASAFIKVQNGLSNTSQPFGPSTKKKIRILLGPILGSLVFIVILVVGFTKFTFRKKRKDSEMEEEYLDQVPGMPTRFSYQELKTTTEDFSKKLGQGGFGSVFEGTLEDGSQIAVKCLQGLAHVKKSFLAEVESIGSIHHVNLVRLRGFCAWKSERLLVYEFMSNGSLDQWIYSGDRKHVLGWECRKKIILDIAKGLAYLHEDCRHKIIHLDIKPQNILLDEDFNAKVADFGLSKLIDRDESQVMTTMRGTPGYLAPEWLSSFITEKVDVYSFGILLLEILCGRKIFDRSQPEESWHLLCVFQRSWEQGTLLNIVDRYSEDMQINGAEVMEMMKVASWCLQTDFTKRPSMSTVIKVLEGVLSVESNLDYNFSYPRLQEATYEEDQKSSKPVLPSILSGPR